MRRQRGFIGVGILIAILLGLIVVGGGAYYVMHQNVVPAAQQNLSQVSTTQQTQQEQNNNGSAQATTNPTTSSSNGILNVAWSAPQTTDGLNVFETSHNWGNNTVPITVTANYYSMGRVSNGSYAGDPVLLAVITGTSGYDWYDGIDSSKYYFLKNGNSLTLLSQDSSVAGKSCGSDNCLGQGFSTDDSSTIAGINYPTNFSYQNTTFKLEGTNTSYSNGYSDPFFNDYVALLQPAFNDASLGQFYSFVPTSTSTKGLDTSGIFVRVSDGTMRMYAVVPPFYNASTSVPSVTWNDGSQNTNAYFYTDQRDCNGTLITMQVPTNFNASALSPVGKTSTGDTVYELTNPSDPILEKVYAYSQGYSTNTGPVPEKFIESHPLFYWQDALGTWIQFEKILFTQQCVG